MLFLGSIAAALVLIASSGYLLMRTFATSVGAPRGYRERLDDPGYQRSWLEELGFRTVGELLYPGSEKNGPPTVEPALVGPDSVTVARARTLREREFTLLTAWPDGGYVLTRCPRRGLLTTRNSASCSLRSASSGAEALSVHAAAVRDFAHSHGQPMEARDTAAVDECYRTAARTWQRELIRTNVVAIPIGLLGCATVIVAVLAR
jgi:hypothetical protein